jgi:hypothetical protein
MLTRGRWLAGAARRCQPHSGAAAALRRRALHGSAPAARAAEPAPEPKGEDSEGSSEGSRVLSAMELQSWPMDLPNRVFNTVPAGAQAVVERGWSGKDSFSKVVVGGEQTGKFTALPFLDQIPFLVDTREMEAQLPLLQCKTKGDEVIEVTSSMRVQFVDGPDAEDKVEERAAYKAAYGRDEPAVFKRIDQATSNPYMAVVFAAWEHMYVEIKSAEASNLDAAVLAAGAKDKMATLGAEWGLVVSEYTIESLENTGVEDDPAALLESYLSARQSNEAQVAADKAREAKKAEAAEAAAKVAAEAAEAERIAALDAEERAKVEAEAAEAAEAEAAAKAAAEEAEAAAAAEKEAAATAEARAQMEVEVPEAVKSKVDTLRSVLKVSEEEGEEGVVAIDDFNLALEMVGVDVSEMADLIEKHTLTDSGSDDSARLNYTALLDEAGALEK